MSVGASDREDRRLGAVRALLEEAGMPGADVVAAGHQAEIAVVRASREHLPLLGTLAGRIKSLGFRYVALDLSAMQAPPNGGT